MGDGVGDTERRRNNRRINAYMAGWTDARDGDVSAHSMATDTDYQEGFQAYLDRPLNLS